MIATAPNPLEHILDRPWTVGGEPVLWMSSQIAAMILAAVVLGVGIPLAASRRRGMVPRGTYAFVEAFVVFVRTRIARPALGADADAWVPFLATLLAFLLGCNLMGLVPLQALSTLVGLHRTPIGGAATSSLYVCGALAAVTLVVVLFGGYWRGVAQLRRGGGGTDGVRAHGNLIIALSQILRRKRRSLPVSLAGGVVVWLDAFVPPVPGVIGMVFWPLMLAMESVGFVARCFALAMRLFLNMTTGHILLAVAVGFAAAARGWAIAYVSLPSAAGAVALTLMECLVAIIQAYVFTLLSAVFIGLAGGSAHDSEGRA
ncbi:MAG TPA: F0F1 ATP synthase subunit A [Phycisphaerae bacterium]|nr:F0F1 ATP synthase subunit A [Phycisphaerae bacterium]